MFRFVITLLFAICLTGASMVHLATAASSNARSMQSTQIETTCEKAKYLFSVQDDSRLECEATRTQRSATHHRCQIDVAPVAIYSENFPPAGIFVGDQIFSKLMRKGFVCPELHPPQVI